MIATLKKRMRLITYGNDGGFDRQKFEPIQNRDFAKPLGGLWSSPASASYGWKEWFVENEYRVDKYSSSFKFWYKGNILKIDSELDMDKLIWRYVYESMQVPDFEAMLAGGVDAIWLTERGEYSTRFIHPKNLYGWDCECVLIMNPDGIE